MTRALILSCCPLHPLVTPKKLLFKISGIFRVGQSDFNPCSNRRNRCRADRGIQAWVRGSDTGPLDWDRRCIYARSAFKFPPQVPVAGRTTRVRPRGGLRVSRPARLAGSRIFFSRVTSTPHPAFYMAGKLWVLRSTFTLKAADAKYSGVGCQ
jgi:hypothetical protein